MMMMMMISSVLSLLLLLMPKNPPLVQRMTRSLVCGMPGVSTMHLQVILCDAAYMLHPRSKLARRPSLSGKETSSIQGLMSRFPVFAGPLFESTLESTSPWANWEPLGRVENDRSSIDFSSI